MKRTLLPLLALGAALFTAQIALAADATTPSATDPKSPKLIKIGTIHGADAVREFQQNVEILQAQRQGAIELKDARDKETDPAKKKELNDKLEALIKKLNENNAMMAKTYGFSLTRNYTMEIESANIYMAVSDEEAAKLEAEKAATAAKKK